MLRRDVMPATYDAALQERESILNGVRVDNTIPSHVLLLVLDPAEAVLESRRERVHVGGKLVRDNEPDVASNMPLRCLLKCLARKVGDYLKAEPSLMPLDHAEHVDSLRLRTPALGLSLNLRVVYLNNFVVQLPVETVRVGHRFSDPMAEIPRRAVARSEHPLELKRGDSLLRLAHDVDGQEPFPKG